MLNCGRRYSRFGKGGIFCKMATIETKIEKLVGLHERGLLTDGEAVNDLFLILADVADSQRLTMLFKSLPERLQAIVHHRLNKLCESDYEWNPFMIGEGFSEAEVLHLRKQLRSIHASLSDFE